MSSALWRALPFWPRAVDGGRYVRPVCTRFLIYDVKLDPVSSAYCATIMRLSAMQQWLADARLEPAEIEELDVEI
jgi:hypothetical protein